MSVFPLNIPEKINSPELLAFFQQFGLDRYLSAEEINKITAALKELKDRVEKFWESTGKKYILSIDKRKLFVRSKHSLINLLFQSTGALIMKYGSLETAYRLDQKDLLGDPFFDSRDAKKIFSMIIYHKYYCGFTE